jgi:hypothetical protein
MPMDDSSQFNAIERRKYIRLKTRIPVKYIILDQTTRTPLSDNLEGVTENLSLAGLRLETYSTEEQIKLFTSKNIILKIEFELPGINYKIKSETKINFIETETKIIYMHIGPNGKSRRLTYLGLVFIDLSEQNKNIILKYIKDKFINEYKPY